MKDFKVFFPESSCLSQSKITLVKILVLKVTEDEKVSEVPESITSLWA